MSDLVDVVERERKEAKRNFCHSEELIRAYRCWVPESVSDGAVLAVKSVGDATVASSPGAGSFVDTPIDESSRFLAIAKAKVTTLSAKLFSSEETRNRGNRKMRIT